jgi:transcriptional regulator of acetoin/glycerol metabolism
MRLLGSGSQATRLERRRLIDRAWELYVQDGVQPTELSDEIQRSWKRAREEYQIDPCITRPRRVLLPEELLARRERDVVLRLAAPILDDFASRLDLSGHVLAYLDGEGWMLAIDGDRRVIEQVADIDFRPGANWAEDSAATNGPGTALAEGKPIEVFASEHFVSKWQPWSCAAAPIRAAGEERPVGLIDITGPWEVQRRQAILVARAIARAVEERLRAAKGVRDEVVRHAFLSVRNTGDALVGVDATGQVIGANEAATKRRIVNAGSLPPAVKKALADILRHGSQPPSGEVPIHAPDGSILTALAVQYEGANVGAILRALPPRACTHTAPARTQPSARYELSRIQGRSPAIERAVELAKTAARNTLPVVIYGESGTGKELFAQAIHSASERRGSRFVAVNCGSIPAQLVEAELFGYESGTFTGARREGNPGRFEDANGGTLFLDEVSELPLQAQTALLRVLQEKEVVRLGGSTPRNVDVRIIAATNKPLDEEIRARRFRRDLYYRLNVFFISVPPLRERGEDIDYLADVFLKEAQGEVKRSGLTLAPETLAALRDHRWPGNVRELKNVLLRAAAIAPRPCISVEDLVLEPGAPATCVAAGRTAGPGGPPRDRAPESERDALVSELEACSWNVARAADRLGISRMTLYRRLHRCGISRKTATGSAASGDGVPPAPVSLAGRTPR